MSTPRKAGAVRESAAEQLMRDQEVLRANRELTAYFKGRRTEREARAALKIIKAFVRDRERRDPRSRPPLPGVPAADVGDIVAKRKPASDAGERPRRKLRRTPQATPSRRATPAIEPQVHPDLPHPSESEERTPE